MEKKQKIVQYRERLDRTLASPDLTYVEILKKLVKNQLLLSSELEDEGYKEKLVEHETAEVSNFLDMLRSASDDCRRSYGSHFDRKLKQDCEEFRVMYRERLEGSSFHTLLEEGFVDGPVDACFCFSWQISLYKKWFEVIALHEKRKRASLLWWPQSTIPTFKILSSECLHKVQIGEQISLVRAIANMDIKLDLVPPSLINVISSQLIGNDFRLYQKVVASMISHDKKEFSKALGEPLYARIHALYMVVMDQRPVGGELRQVANILPEARQG